MILEFLILTLTVLSKLCFFLSIIGNHSLTEYDSCQLVIILIKKKYCFSHTNSINNNNTDTVTNIHIITNTMIAVTLTKNKPD